MFCYFTMKFPKKWFYNYRPKAKCLFYFFDQPYGFNCQLKARHNTLIAVLSHSLPSFLPPPSPPPSFPIYHLCNRVINGDKIRMCQLLVAAVQSALVNLAPRPFHPNLNFNCLSQGFDPELWAQNEVILYWTGLSSGGPASSEAFYILIHNFFFGNVFTF